MHVYRSLRITMTALMAVLLLLAAACGKSSPDRAPQSSSGSSGDPAPAASGSETAESPAEKVTISFWNGFTGPDGDLLKTIVDEYNASNTDHVEVKMDIMPWDQLFQKLPPAIATNTAPDLVVMWPGAARTYIENRTFLPLDDYFEKMGVDRSAYTEASLDFGKGRTGTQYMLPMQVQPIYLFWNKTLFKEAGLDPDRPPATLEELEEYAVKLTDPAKNRFGLGLPVKGSPAYFVPFIKGNGGDFVDTENLKSVLNSPENIATLTWLQDLVVNKKVSPAGATGADMDKLMLSGQMGMFITGPWLVGGLRENNIDFGVAPPPAGSKRQFIEIDGIGFSIPKGTGEKEKEAAYKFIRFWSSKETVKRWSLANGFPPFLIEVMEDPDIQNDPLVSSMSAMGDSGEPFLRGLITAGTISDDALWPMIELIQAGRDVAETVKSVSDHIDEILKSEPR
jgi:ABC-type sugar transport system, periplasmic component